MTSLAITKLDVLAGIDPLRIATGYRHPEGARSTSSPTTSRSSTPPRRPTRSCRASRATSPAAARWRSCPAPPATYVEAVAELSGVEVRLVGVGPARDQVIWTGAEPELRAA